MKIILLIFSAIQVTTLQGLPMTCTNRIVNRFMIMMPSPFREGKWIFFSWPIRKTIIMNGATAGNDEDVIVKNEYEKIDYWSKMNGEWKEEIKNFITNKYAVPNMSKENFKIFGLKNSEKSEYLSKKEGEWLQEIKEYFKKKYLSPLGSKTSIFSKNCKPENDFWSKGNCNWAQHIRDYKQIKFSSQAKGRFPEKIKCTNKSTTKPSAEIQEIRHESSQPELNESSLFTEKENFKDLELDSTQKYEKGKIEKKPIFNLNFMTSKEAEIFSSEMIPQEEEAPKNKEEEAPKNKEEEAPKNKEEEENSIFEKDLSAEILGKWGKIDKFQLETSKIVENVDSTSKPFTFSSNKDDIFASDISKFDKESDERIYQPENSKIKIKEKVTVHPQKDVFKEKTSPIVYSFKKYKTQNFEPDEKFKNSYEKKENEKNDKLSVIFGDEEKKLYGMPAKTFKKTINNKAKGNSKNGKTLDSDESYEKWQESLKNEEEVKNYKLGVVSGNETEKILENSEGSGEFNNNFPGFGTLKVQFKKHKIPYGLAKKLQEDQETDKSVRWSKESFKRFMSV